MATVSIKGLTQASCGNVLYFSHCLWQQLITVTCLYCDDNVVSTRPHELALPLQVKLTLITLP